MAQKFHRARMGMADKDTLEVCFAIDSDEDRDVVAEDDNTEGRTSEDEVPPQVCKNTANKRHVTMEPAFKRTTAFNVFCSERLKANSHAGFQPEEWGNEWRTLTDAAKKQYEAKALAIRHANIDAKTILKNINNMTNLLKENKEEVIASGIEGVCTIVCKNNLLYFTEFGNLTGISKNPTIFNLIQGHANAGSTDNAKRGTIRELRDKVIAKMSKIAKSQLGLNQFPYERAKKGEFVISGIPPSLMPLECPAMLATKELNIILDCEITVTRVPSRTKSTENFLQQTQTQLAHTTSYTDDAILDTLQHTQNQLTHATSCTHNDAIIDTLDEAQTQLVHGTSSSSSSTDKEATENTLQPVQTQLVHGTQTLVQATSSSSTDNEATRGILHQIQTQLLHNTTHTNSTLDPNRQTQLLQMSQHISPAETTVGRTPGYATEGQSLSQLIPDKPNQPDGTVKENSAMQHQESSGKKPRTVLKTPWTAAEVLIVQQHFSQELAGLKPVTRNSIDSFLARQTLVKRTSTALGNYLLRNRKKIRPDDQ